MLKRFITKDDHEALSDDLKKEYVEHDGGGFRLLVSDDEEVDALRRAKDREVHEKAEAKKRVKELEDELSKLSNDDIRKRGDIKALDKSWEEKLARQREEYEIRQGQLNGHLKAMLVDSVASEIAHKISSAPAIILPHIRQRLAADLDGDRPVTRVLDASGNPSALTVDELANEFVQNKDFSSIIVGSKATGGAGAGKGNVTPPVDKPADIGKLTPQEMARYVDAKKEQSKNSSTGRF